METKKEELIKVAEKLKKKGAKKLFIEDRFEAADLTRMYKSSYRNLCSTHHNSLASLQQRFIKFDSDGNPNLILENEVDQRNSNLYWATSILVLHNSFAKLLDQEGLDDEPEFDELASEMNLLDKKYLTQNR